MLCMRNGQAYMGNRVVLHMEYKRITYVSGSGGLRSGLLFAEPRPESGNGEGEKWDRTGTFLVVHSDPRVLSCNTRRASNRWTTSDIGGLRLGDSDQQLTNKSLIGPWS